MAAGDSSSGVGSHEKAIGKVGRCVRSSWRQMMCDAIAAGGRAASLARVSGPAKHEHAKQSISA